MHKRGPLAVLRAISEGRFLSLLICLLLYIGFAPFLYGIAQLRFFSDIFFTAILISGISAVSEKVKHAAIAMILAFPMLISIWALHWYPHKILVAVETVFGSLFIGYTVVLLFVFILSSKVITRHVIFAAISVYLLMGVLWSLLYGLLEVMHPGSFEPAIQGFKPGESGLLYFSFVTLTTLGYGDILPVSPDARSLAILEALLGQLYLAVLVARLVGVHVARKTGGD